MSTEAERSPKPAGRRGPGAKSAERRQAIVEAAHEVFAERGYHAGSFQEIADRVGMSQTGLLYYFPSKSELLLEVLHRRDAVSAGRVEARWGDASNSAMSSGLVDGILARAEANKSIPGVIELYTVLCGESATAGHPAHPYFVDRFENLRTRYAAELRELQAQGLLRAGVDPDRAAASLIALWDGIQLQWLLAPDRVDVVACLRDYLEQLFE
ncbi:TetR/AcrR family transcriptional regulator [Herbiconiux sp. 11R-BC]|uniref:TetR/AcrR family transcriptional regulator n=1 Tax=Herbiconiux sp. 11R-BC TaxID=3111637 RepID=UPI003BFB6920